MESAASKETNPVLECIYARRSIRRYKSDMVPESAIATVAEAGTYAPTGRGMQSPVIIAITNRETRDRLSQVNAEIFGRPNFDPFYGAPVILAVVADKARSTAVYDGSLVIGTMLLAAKSIGLGACWIHRAKETFERPEWQEFLKQQGLTGDYEGIGFLALGYADQDPKAAPRKDDYIRWVR